MGNVLEFKRRRKPQTATAVDFGDRVQNIRHSLDRINTLMADLKKMTEERRERKTNPQTTSTTEHNPVR